jgi:hypothetical protein
MADRTLTEDDIRTVPVGGAQAPERDPDADDDATDDAGGDTDATDAQGA